MRISVPILDLLINLGRYVCPIYVIQDKKRQTPFLIGTGTLYEDDNEFYLTTAKHVIDEAKDKQLIIAGDNTFILLVGEQISWDYKSGENIDYDICIIHLHPKIVDSLRNFYRFTTPTDISNIAKYNKLILYVFVGHPHTKNKP